MSDEKLSPLADATSGALGAVMANMAVFPLDVIKTRLQVQSKQLAALHPTQQYDSALDAFIKILQTEGVAGLYSGLAAGLFGTVASSFSYFYFYSTIRGAYHRRYPGEITTAMELLLGAVAGAASQLCTLPIAVVTTRQQTAPKHEQRPFLETMLRIRQKEGVQGLWKGLKASLVLCVNPAITYGMFERLKRIWLQRMNNVGGRLTPGQTFIVGALSKTLATIVTYPYIMAKVRMQWAPPKSVSELSEKDRQLVTYKSSIDVLKKVLSTDGVLGWYKGMQAQITKAVFCQAILFVCKDQIAVYTLMLFSLLSKRQPVVKPIA
ncbi:ADP/ATP carrier protein [Borealophlyctis nickersoniae]|nr:ADP/ATP carrier protein [Borealophlyctis nickersoniae]